LFCFHNNHNFWATIYIDMIIHEIETYGPQGKGDMNATYKIVIMDAGNHHHRHWIISLLGLVFRQDWNQTAQVRS